MRDWASVVFCVPAMLCNPCRLNRQIQTANRGPACGAEGAALFRGLSNWTEYSGPLMGHWGEFNQGGKLPPASKHQQNEGKSGSQPPLIWKSILKIKLAEGWWGISWCTSYSRPVQREKFGALTGVGGGERGKGGGGGGIGLEEIREQAGKGSRGA